jgi:hypothetical protein
MSTLEGFMKSLRNTVLALVAVATASCSSIAPVRVNAGEQCFRCRRSILDTRLAGETIDRNGFVSKFRAPGCMAKYIAAHPDETGTVFVTDYATGTMIGPKAAVFVPFVVDSNTGESDYRAYRQLADAEAAAVALKATPVNWTTVLDRAR